MNTKKPTDHTDRFKLFFNSIVSQLILLSIFLYPSLSADEQGFTPLFDGKTLNGWQSSLSKNVDDLGPFSVNEKEKAIHVYAGKKNGSEQASDCLVSKKEYSHYILKLEYKWLENRYAPRTDWDRDAGLLFHVHGNLSKVWPHSLEMQIGETPGQKFMKRRFHTGDLFVIGSHLRVQYKREGKIWDPNGVLGTHKSGPTKLGVEKPKGEWNAMEIHVIGSEKAKFILNGEVVFEIANMEQKVGDQYIPLDKGHIGLQAEWAEILYRNILIKELPTP